MNAQLKPPGLASYANGLHLDIPEHVYHERVIDIANNGGLAEIARTPAHYLAWTKGIDEETPAKVFGKAFHMRILQPELFASTYIGNVKHPYRRVTEAQRNAKKPSPETLDAIAYWDEWEIKMGGKIPLMAEDSNAIEAMAASVFAHPIAGRLVRNGVAEATALWVDHETGVRCKARWDYWKEELVIIADVKTADDAGPKGFAKSIANYRYHVQESHYKAGARALGFRKPQFLYLAIEKDPPYAVAVHQLDLDSQEEGHAQRAHDMARLAECLKTNKWPGYPETVNTISLPGWAFGATKL